FQSTVCKKSRAWLGVIPPVSSPICARFPTSSPDGTFTIGLGPSRNRTQSLYWVVVGVGPVMLLAIAPVAVAGPGHVPYCAFTDRGICTASDDPSSDCGKARLGCPASLTISCSRARSTVTFTLCSPPTTRVG